MTAARGRRAPIRTGDEGAGRWVRAGLTAVVGAVVVGTLLSYAAVPGFRVWVNLGINTGVKRLERTLGIGTPVAVRSVQAEASSSVAGHPAANLIDLISDDYWAADTRTDRQPQIHLSFSGPTDLDDLLVTSGAGRDYARLARPKDIQVIYPDGGAEKLTLTDDPRAKRYEVHGSQVRSVDIRILSVYGSQQSTSVAIAELEFFRLRQG